MSLKFRGLLTFAFAIVVANGALAAEAKRPNNVILFVADGLRALSVTADTAPAMTAVREVGVNFKNPHSVFPTFTTAIAAVGRTDAILGRQCCGFSAGSHALGPLVIGILNAREDFLRNIGNPTLKAAHRHDPRAADGGSRRGDRAMIQTERSG
jgi:Type I phosphodiesterase / nucleotide pyrophosphatase